MSLEKLRNKIDKIDEKILKLMAERFEVTEKIGLYKKQNSLKTVDKNREKEMLTKFKVQSEKLNLPFKQVKKIFQEILNLSYLSQKK